MVNKIQLQGKKISYEMTGHGKPVIFLHGFAEDRSIWNDISKALADTYLIITPDLPGTGESDLLHRDGVTMDDYADCIKGIVEAEGLEEIILIGHSMGGYIILAFAEKYPELLKSAGLFHSSAYADNEEKIVTRRKAITFIKENGASAFLKTMIPALFKDPEKHKELVDLQISKGQMFSDEALIQYYEAMIARPDRTHILKHVHIPFLMIMGESDKAVPFKDSLTQSQLPSVSYVHILRNSGHMGMFEEKDNCITILTNFLQEVYQ